MTESTESTINLAATSTMERVKIVGLRGNASPESIETSLWTWFYDLLHPCHPHDENHHDCHHHHDSSGGSSGGGSYGDDAYNDDVNVGGTDYPENISNDLDDTTPQPSDGTFTISDVFTGKASTSSYVMFMLMGAAFIGAIMAAVMIRRKRQQDEEALAANKVELVKNRHSSFRFFAMRSKSFGSVEPGAFVEMGETKSSNVDFVRVSEK
eukprot:CAMPEP_0196801450 /NCGR_PEP_ID=MMETSP1362-20130617/1211_1 /TAXON_ID=163516 /ORGANISM="Leptocylindrus danicus, Strain CCMP1856" /LENGTH=209 /DNA_ID=CAMNT_0042172423 /DNA_START=22 /DNA_END=651 /DNA_ORIENTATION=+